MNEPNYTFSQNTRDPRNSRTVFLPPDKHTMRVNEGVETEQ